ncbi:MAG: hypothetical protein H5U40_05955 [Polyangiaceae bacterium]|nr:hypothetical protein [Polyangiaceae bacterium]
MKRLLCAVVALAPLAMAPTCDSAQPSTAVPEPSDRIAKPTPAFGCTTYLCPGHSEPLACGDCIDNDGDGQVDYGWDQNCTGVCDDDESGLAASLPATPPVGCRAECYFDGGIGGAQACMYDLRCDPLEPRAIGGGRTRFESCEYVGDEAFATEPIWGSSTCADLAAALDDANGGEACSTSCGALTPPGCDCFGCCELPARSGNFVYLGTRTADGAATCTYEAAAEEFASTGGDPGALDRACRLCTPAATCQKPCLEGDRCLGETIPPVCVLPEPPLPPRDPRFVCAETSSSCVDTADCPATTYCVEGCCQIIIVL